jgi:hypothetical protein
MSLPQADRQRTPTDIQTAPAGTGAAMDLQTEWQRPRDTHPTGKVLRKEQARGVREDFLRLVASGMSVNRACLQMRILRFYLYEWRQQHPGFAKAWERAKAQGAFERLRVIMARQGLALTVAPLKLRPPWSPGPRN